MVSILGAHGRGDQRNIWVLERGKLEEVTPYEDTTRAARELAKAMGARFYLRRSAQGESFGWVAYAVESARPESGGKWFPSREAAIMYAVMKGG